MADVLNKIEATERAWLSGEISDSLAEAPEYSAFESERRLRNVQVRAPYGLPDFEYATGYAGRAKRQG